MTRGQALRERRSLRSNLPPSSPDYNGQGDNEASDRRPSSRRGRGRSLAKDMEKEIGRSDEIDDIRSESESKSASSSSGHASDDSGDSDFNGEDTGESDSESASSEVEDTEESEAEEEGQEEESATDDDDDDDDGKRCSSSQKGPSRMMVEGGEGQVTIGGVSTIAFQRIASGETVPMVTEHSTNGVSPYTAPSLFATITDFADEFRPKFDNMVEMFKLRYDELSSHILAASTLILGFTNRYYSPRELYDAYQLQPEHIFGRPVNGLPDLETDALDALFHSYFREDRPESFPELAIVLHGDGNGQQITRYRLADSWRTNNADSLVVRPVSEERSGNADRRRSPRQRRRRQASEVMMMTKMERSVSRTREEKRPR